MILSKGDIQREGEGCRRGENGLFESLVSIL